MSSENELKIRSHIVNLNTEISNILKKEDFGDESLSKFYTLVQFLHDVNATTAAPNINTTINEMANYCKSKPETKYKFEELLKVTQGLMDKIKF